MFKVKGHGRLIVFSIAFYIFVVINYPTIKFGVMLLQCIDQHATKSFILMVR